MRQVTCSEQDRKLLEGGLRQALKAAIAAAAQAQDLPEARAGAERDRDRLKELLEVVRDESGAMLHIERQPTTEAP